jgi:hypothetical protein
MQFLRAKMETHTFIMDAKSHFKMRFKGFSQRFDYLVTKKILAVVEFVRITSV